MSASDGSIVAYLDDDADRIQTGFHTSRSRS